MMDVLAAGTERGDGAIVVTTKDGAERVLKRLQKRTAYGEAGRRRRLRHSTAGRQRRPRVRPDQVRLLARGHDGHRDQALGVPAGVRRSGIEQNRVMVHSLSTLLMYSDLQTVFRFLHVFTGRIQSA